MRKAAMRCLGASEFKKKKTFWLLGKILCGGKNNRIEDFVFALLKILHDDGAKNY
jgi:hypothetical protein